MPSDNELLRKIGVATELRLRPTLRLLTIADAVVDSQVYAFGVPSGSRWRLRSGYLQLLTSDTVGNRRVWLQGVRAGTRFLYLPATDVQPEGRTGAYTFAMMQGDLNFVSDYLLITMPEIILQEGDAFSLSGFLASDAVQAMSFLVEQW
jgi:hypothetical protein